MYTADDERVIQYRQKHIPEALVYVRKGSTTKWSRPQPENEEKYLEASDSFEKQYQRELEKTQHVADPTPDKTVKSDGYKQAYFSPVIVIKGGTLERVRCFAKSYFIILLDQNLAHHEIFFSSTPQVSNKSAYLLSKMSEDPDYFNSEALVFRDSFDMDTKKSDMDGKYCLAIKVLCHVDNSYVISLSLQKKLYTLAVLKANLNKRGGMGYIKHSEQPDLQSTHTNINLIRDLKKMDLCGPYIDPCQLENKKEIVKKNINKVFFFKKENAKKLEEMPENLKACTEENQERAKLIYEEKLSKYTTMEMRQTVIKQKKLDELYTNQKNTLKKAKQSFWLFFLYTALFGTLMPKYLFKIRISSFNQQILSARLMLIEALAKGCLHCLRSKRNYLGHTYYASIMIMDQLAHYVAPKIIQKTSNCVATFIKKSLFPMEMFFYTTVYVERIKDVFNKIYNHKILKRKIFGILESEWERELFNMSLMSEYTFRKALIIVGVKGTEIHFRDFTFESYKFIFTNKLIFTYLTHQINVTITKVTEAKIKKNFKNIDYDAARILKNTQLNTTLALKRKRAKKEADEHSIKIKKDEEEKKRLLAELRAREEQEKQDKENKEKEAKKDMTDEEESQHGQNDDTDVSGLDTTKATQDQPMIETGVAVNKQIQDAKNGEPQPDSPQLTQKILNTGETASHVVQVDTLDNKGETRIQESNLRKQQYKYRIGYISKLNYQPLKNDIYELAKMTQEFFQDFQSKTKKGHKSKFVEEEQQQAKIQVDHDKERLSKNIMMFLKVAHKKNSFLDEYLSEFGYHRGIIRALCFVIIKFFVEGKLPSSEYSGKK